MNDKKLCVYCGVKLPLNDEGKDNYFCLYKLKHLKRDESCEKWIDKYAGIHQEDALRIALNMREDDKRTETNKMYKRIAYKTAFFSASGAALGYVLIELLKKLRIF